MAHSTINKSTDYFNTITYTGNGGTNALTGVGFQPDLTWIKETGATGDHFLCDVVRGVTKYILSNASGAEGTNANTLTAFGTDGFTVGSDGWTNNNSDTYVAWNWKAGGAGSANTAGTINSTVSVNTTAGFSIVKYTGNGTSGATVGHGLGIAPKIVLIKKTSGSAAWSMLNTNIDLNKYLRLDTDAAEVSDALFNNTAPSSTLFTLDSDGQVNGSGNEFIAYCFAEIDGYSKFGSFSGNGDADGPFIYTGFKPNFVMTKKIGGTADWMIRDNKRDGINVTNKTLQPNSSNAEASSSDYDMDLLSNGFKLRANSGHSNSSGQTMIYMAFGQSLVGSNNVPCTAR